MKKVEYTNTISVIFVRIRCISLIRSTRPIHQSLPRNRSHCESYKVTLKFEYGSIYLTFLLGCQNCLVDDWHQTV